MLSSIALTIALAYAAVPQDVQRLTLSSESVPLRGPARRIFVAPDGAHLATLGTDGAWCVQALQHLCRLTRAAMAGRIGIQTIQQPPSVIGQAIPSGGGVELHALDEIGDAARVLGVEQQGRDVGIGLVGCPIQQIQTRHQSQAGVDFLPRRQPALTGAAPQVRPQ